jgi:hypothetical protein
MSVSQFRNELLFAVGLDGDKGSQSPEECIGKPALPYTSAEEPQREEGKVGNTPPKPSGRCPLLRTRESLKGMLRRVGSRQARAQRNSEALQAVGWGIVVGVWENHTHQDGN